MKEEGEAVRFIDREAFAPLLAELEARRYELIGPTVRDGTIVLDAIEGPGDLPRGVAEIQGAGTYRLEDRGDDRLFGFAHGPHSAKQFLFPPVEVVAEAERVDGRLRVEEPVREQPKYAFIGLRSCDLHAMAIQDRVLLSDPSYRARREAAFVVAVNCSEPGATCFCRSTGTGPRCGEGFDLALTELVSGFLVEVGTARGGEVLEAVGSAAARPEQESEARRIWSDAGARMGRRVDTAGLRDLLYRNRENAEWRAIADVCPACGNCTAVCPTCFCHDVVDATDITGGQATRTRTWASCFSQEFSHTAGGDVRTSREARYRQWLTHKFAGWIEQFGTSGCVGCGRCITWCPVGIDITRELEAIRSSDGALQEAAS